MQTEFPEKYLLFNLASKHFSYNLGKSVGINNSSSSSLQMVSLNNIGTVKSDVLEKFIYKNPR